MSGDIQSIILQNFNNGSPNMLYTFSVLLSVLKYLDIKYFVVKVAKCTHLPETNELLCLYAL